MNLITPQNPALFEVLFMSATQMIQGEFILNFKGIFHPLPTFAELQNISIHFTAVSI